MFIDGQNASITLGANITYGNTWSQQAGTLTVVGETLTLTGDTSLDGGAVVGAGTMNRFRRGGAGRQLQPGPVRGAGHYRQRRAGERHYRGPGRQHARRNCKIAKGVTYTMDDSVNILGSGTLSSPAPW